MKQRQAENIRRRYAAFEHAREVFDPKRFKRGGGYTPADYRQIAKMAGVRKPTNEEMGKLEVYEFTHHPPEKLFAYYSSDMKRITSWMGDVLGTITHVGRERRPMGGRVVSVRVQAINGLSYVGQCNLSSGSYCRLRRSTGRK
jgi:hypothetical protein